MKITLLGTGTSQGVPVIACTCPACTSDDSRDKRLRCSLLIESETTKLVVDIGPDFRQQMLKYGPDNLNAVLLTHEHNDHVAGIDDLRPFIFKQNKNMPIYAMARVLNDMKKRYSYAFKDSPYPGLPKFDLSTITLDPFMIGDIQIIPIRVLHGSLPILGFRFGPLTYITDALTIEDPELEKIQGSKIIIINALQIKEHYSHLNLSGAIKLIESLAPEQAFLTHISHKMGPTKEWEKILPENVYPTYDGLVFEL